MVKYSLVFIPNSILWWFIDASDRFFVSFMCGTAINGLYAISYKIPTMLNTISTIFVQSWQMSAIKEYEGGNNSNFYEQVYKQIIFFMGIATLILIYLNKFILTIYVGTEYKTAWVYSPFLIIAFFAGALGNFWGSFYIATKNMKKYLYSAIIGAIVNVCLNFLLIEQIGAIGAAIATMLCYIIVFIIRAKGLEQLVHLKLFNLELLSISICLIIGLIASYLPNRWGLPIGIVNILFYLFLNKRLIKLLILLIKNFIIDHLSHL